MRTRWPVGLLLGGCLVAAGACSEIAVGPPRDGIVPPDVDLDAASDVREFEIGDDAEAPSDLCGTAAQRRCDPDLAAVCVSLRDAGPSGDADTEPPDDAPDAFVADGGTEDAAGDADVQSADGGATISACRVVAGDLGPAAVCAPAGEIEESQFCRGDAECAPGLACVGEPGLGRCLRYCCAASRGGAAPTDAGLATHYCTARPLSADPAVRVPVWIRLDDCTLLGDELQCPSGTTCSVVTDDGRTTCVRAGTARDHERCDQEPCDRGYVCLGRVERRCRKLCVVDKASECPSGGYCQPAPTMPEGYGICTAGDAGPR